MTPRDRVLTAIAHEPPDRVPIQIYLTPEIQAKLAEHFASDALEEILGVDFRTVGPRFVGEARPVPEQCAGVDEWGTGYIMKEYPGGTYPEPYHQPLAGLSTLKEVDEYHWPRLEDYDFSDLEAQCDAVAEYAVCLGGAGIPDIVNGVGRGRGMELVLLDIMTQDPVGIAVIDKRCDFYYALCRRALETANGKIDILCLGEDCGNQRGPMFDPAIFDGFFRPRLQRFYDLGHEFGCKVMMHSCGSTRKLMSRFVEMGLDVLDAVQPEPAGMDPGELKREHGDKLAFCGMISTQNTLPHGTAEACRAEARHRIEVVGEGGGYIFAPAHCIQPDTPVENVLAIYEEALGLEAGTLSRKDGDEHPGSRAP
jgi:uroporphyrinogen decarboxylase